MKRIHLSASVALGAVLLGITGVGLSPVSGAVIPTLDAASTVRDAPPRADSLDRFVDSLMAEYDREDSPGAAVGVIRGGELSFAGAYGMADLTHQIPNTAATKFNLGSGAKQFMAYAFALLAERGELSLDDPVSEHLADWPEFEETVTLRHLLTHTSGYREAYGTSMLAGRMPGRDYLAREEALEVVRRQPKLEFPAGSDWKYNSTAWVILAEVAEEVTGQSMSQWMGENVFDPLGMEHTTIETQVGQVIPGAAFSYAGNREDGFRMEWSNRAIFGAAEVYTAVGDLARWFRNFRSAELGGPAVMDRMTERYVLTDGDTTDYALGLFIDEHRGLRRIQHGGSHAGYRAQLSYYPELDAGVVVMSNYAGVSSGHVADQVAEFAFGDHMAPEAEGAAEPGSEPTPSEADAVSVDADVLASYAGSYRDGEGRRYRFVLEDGELLAEGERRMLPVSDTVLRVVDTPFRLVFHPSPSRDAVERATLELPGGSRQLERRPSWEPTLEELERYTGRYYSPELETVYTIRVDDGRLVSVHRWNGVTRYDPVQRDEFEGQQGPSIRFERNEVGLITGFYASVGRTEDVWFHKRN